MARNTLEHRASHQADHDVTDITEWQTNAIQPFVERLNHTNPELTRELQREYDAVTGTNTPKEHVSWLDDHDKDTWHPASYNYEERDKSKAERDILTAYREAVNQLDDEQTYFLTATIVEAMTHRPNAYFSEHFPQSVEDFTDHHQHDTIHHPASYNSMMEAARDYYAAAIQQTEYLLTQELKAEDEWDPYSITWPVDTLRSLEHDLREGAEHGKFPKYLDSIDESEEFTRRYMERGNALAEEFSKDFKETHPDEPLNPDTEAYVNHFQQYTAGYSQGDLRNVADYIAYNQGIDKANKEGGRNVEELADRMKKYRAHTFEQLAKYPYGTP